MGVHIHQTGSDEQPFSLHDLGGLDEGLPNVSDLDDAVSLDQEISFPVPPAFRIYYPSASQQKALSH
jgi:hypothetical protein